MSKFNLKSSISQNRVAWAVGGTVAGFIGLAVFVSVTAPPPEVVSQVKERSESAPAKSAPAPAKSAPAPAKSAPAPAKSDAGKPLKPVVAVWPQHEGLPMRREEDHPNFEELGYLVMLEPVGGLGQLRGELVYSADESDSFVSNCFDIRQKRSNADMRIGEYDGMEMYFDDYATWILRAAISFCDTDFPADKTPVSQAEPEPPAPSPLSAPRSYNQAVVNAGDGVANLREIASTESDVIGKVSNGTVIEVLEQTTNSSGQRWLRTPEGWIWAGLTQNEPLDYDPQRESPPATQAALARTASAPAPAPAQNCDSSYSGVCIPPYSQVGDLDCGEISHKDFRVTGSDPHGFDRDRDGLGCES